MTMYAQVRTLWLAGFEIGPSPGQLCPICQDLWGEHVLKAEGDPINGGTYACYLTACACEGTWTTSNRPAFTKGDSDETSGP